MINKNPDQEGFYGDFGGAFVPEVLAANLKELQEKYIPFIESEEFQTEFQDLLQNYLGRATPLYHAKKLSAKYGTHVYLKREDLNHTGSHKMNNALGQILLAEKLGKKRIIAETGAGQHGVATATACALRGLECVIYMGEVDMVRQATNVSRMKMLGAEVRAARSGTKTLKDAVNEALEDWIQNPDTYYLIGSAVGPHPYPDMVTRFQSVISKEIKTQFEEKVGGLPTHILAAIGGGSNAAGAFYHFIGEPNVQLVAAEASGHGLETDKTAATLHLGTTGVLHGSKSKVMQTADGQLIDPHSISAGLDYPGIGPLHAYLHDINQLEIHDATDQEALEAGRELTQLEGILPALESAHALVLLKKVKFKPEDQVVVNLSGRGDKDLPTYLKAFGL
ncbi:tryptophan synthase subunit beta [Flavobacteriaceae bacterium Ap0902]|nr:tryptophan synthase subunit beta [Flavobacteriaceae bacterium Ap0902]